MKTIPPILLTYIDGLKAHDVGKIADTIAGDCLFVTPATTVNKERFLTFLCALYAAFPDWHYDHDEPELREEQIAVKWRQGGTHTGAFAQPGIEVAATGKKVIIPEQFFFYRIRDNRIVEIRPERSLVVHPKEFWNRLA